MALPATSQQTDFRGYLQANGKFQIDPNWSINASGRLASDRTFLRRYDISRDDRLRSMIDLERIGWDEGDVICGLIVVGDSQVATGMMRVTCDATHCQTPSRLI